MLNRQNLWECVREIKEFEKQFPKKKNLRLIRPRQHCIAGRPVQICRRTVESKIAVI